LQLSDFATDSLIHDVKAEYLLSKYSKKQWRLWTKEAAEFRWHM